jgi:hypothetical protein
LAGLAGEIAVELAAARAGDHPDEQLRLAEPWRSADDRERAQGTRPDQANLAMAGVT